MSAWKTVSGLPAINPQLKSSRSSARMCFVFAGGTSRKDDLTAIVIKRI